ncbi:MAG: nucleotidyltransferase domain-containing protein [Dehalococcoidia bacterium]
MNSRELVRRRREYRRLLHHSASEIVTRLSHLDVHRISLFGSYARGRSDLLTDLDVLVVMESDKAFPERIAEIHGLLALPVDADILCYTPQEFERMRETPFLRKALADEVVLYEKRAA